jgi:hypothetical protein
MLYPGFLSMLQGLLRSHPLLDLGIVSMMPGLNQKVKPSGTSTVAYNNLVILVFYTYEAGK